jgi:hypothetical protein
MSSGNRTFAEIMDRKHLDMLEAEIVVFALGLEDEGGRKGENIHIVYALIAAGCELVKRERETATSIDESFFLHIIDRCNRELAKLQSSYS